MEKEAMDFVPEKGFYQPRNDETWESYQALLCVVEQQLGQLGRFPRPVVCGVADEILGIFRNRYLTHVQKRFEVEKLIGILSIDVFNQLVLSTNEIKDYNRRAKEEDEETWKSRQEEEEEEEEEEEVEGYFYQPRSTETWRAYNTLLNAVVTNCGVQPQLVLYCAANELIAVMKNENIKEDDLKKRLIGNILNLGYVNDQLLKDLVAIVGLITDYNPKEFVGPTDLIREDSLMMMMGEEERKEQVKREGVADEDQPVGMWQSSPPWSDGEEEDPMVEDGDVGPVKDDLVVENESMGPVVEYHLVRDMKEKLVLNEVKESSSSSSEEEDGWVVRKIMKNVKEKLVLNEVKKEEDEDEDEWVVV